MVRLLDVAGNTIAHGGLASVVPNADRLDSRAAVTGAAGNGEPARGVAGFAVAALLAGCALLSCAPDLHESVGPLVPVPNVTGRVTRGDVPAGGVPVDLADTLGVTFDDVSTDSEGAYGLEAGAGHWVVEAKSGEPGDYDEVTYQFAFLSADTAAAIPDLDISMAALELAAPADSAVMPVPNIFAPVTFEWSWTVDGGAPARFRVRLYSLDGVRLWSSEKTTETRIGWNGIGNEGEYSGKLVDPGQYRWRLRVYRGESSIEYTTGYRAITFIE